MKYKRFEDLPVWQAAMDLCVRIFALTEGKALNNKADLRSQIQRAGLSVCNNVAEGFERGTTQELLTFLYIARGSAGEVRSMLLLMDRLPYFVHLKSGISDLASRAESVSRQLRAWADSLQNSDFGGARYVTDKTRRKVGEKQSSREFFDKLDRLAAEGRRSAPAAGPGAEA
jgi:four helix bundle protein